MIHSLFQLGTTSTQNSCFLPGAIKSSVASALVKNVPSFSSNSDKSLASRACLAIFKENSNHKSNLVLKDHSRSHILTVLLNLLYLCLFLVFVFLPLFQILVMLWYKNPVLILTHLRLVLSQIRLHNVLFVTQNSQVLRFLTLLNHPSQFLQQIAIIFLFRFLQVLNLMIQNLLVRLLKHLTFCLFL